MFLVFLNIFLLRIVRQLRCHRVKWRKENILSALNRAAYTISNSLHHFRQWFYYPSPFIKLAADQTPMRLFLRYFCLFFFAIFVFSCVVGHCQMHFSILKNSIQWWNSTSFGISCYFFGKIFFFHFWWKGKKCITMLQFIYLLVRVL